MNSITATSRRAGVLYLLMGITGPYSLIYFPRAFVAPQDAAATARKITESVFAYRVFVLTELVAPICFLFLAWTLYNLFKDVDKKLSMLLVILVSVSATLGIANVVNLIAPLVILSRADFLSVYTQPQLDALALLFLKLRSSGISLNTAFWGLWLFPLGMLVIKSRYFPKFVGVLLIVGCFAYLAGCFTSILFPAHMRVVSNITLPLAIGELFMMIWLLKGANAQPEEALS